MRTHVELDKKDTSRFGVRTNISKELDAVDEAIRESKGVELLAPTASIETSLEPIPAVEQSNVNLENVKKRLHQCAERKHIPIHNVSPKVFAYLILKQSGRT